MGSKHGPYRFLCTRASAGDYCRKPREEGGGMRDAWGWGLGMRCMGQGMGVDVDVDQDANLFIQRLTTHATVQRHTQRASDSTTMRIWLWHRPIMSGLGGSSADRRRIPLSWVLPVCLLQRRLVQLPLWAWHAAAVATQGSARP